MEISIFLAEFWGSLFMILGALSVGAKLLGHIIEYTEEHAITVSTGYITFLLGLATVVAHNIWVLDWRIVITLLGWGTLFKGIMKIAFPTHINKRAQLFKRHAELWGMVIFLLGAGIFWIGYGVLI